MAYALRPGLHCCTVEGQTLCLDVAENRYFGLNAEAGNIVQRLAGSCPGGWCRKVSLRGWPPSIFC
jgi:hypothetical protein